MQLSQNALDACPSKPACSPRMNLSKCSLWFAKRFANSSCGNRKPLSVFIEIGKRPGLTTLIGISTANGAGASGSPNHRNKSLWQLLEYLPQDPNFAIACKLPSIRSSDKSFFRSNVFWSLYAVIHNLWIPAADCSPQDHSLRSAATSSDVIFPVSAGRFCWRSCSSAFCNASRARCCRSLPPRELCHANAALPITGIISHTLSCGCCSGKFICRCVWQPTHR